MALAAFPGIVRAQPSLPPLPAAGGGVTDRLSPEDVERANQRRLREQVVSRLRELQARGEYTEMLRLIQEAEKTLPNDMVLKQYGYMAQMGLESVRDVDRPLVSPNSPVLRGTGGAVPSGLPVTGTAGASLPGSGITGTGTTGTGLPQLPGTGSVSSGQSLPALPPLPPAGSQTPSSQPSSSLPSLPTGLPDLPADDNKADSQDSADEDDEKLGLGSEKVRVIDVDSLDDLEAEEGGVRRSATRLILFGIMVLLVVLGLGAYLFQFIRRRKRSNAVAAPRAPEKASGVAAGAAAAAGAVMPPPSPPGVAAASRSMRDALTEVDVSEEEVARDIAQNIGTRGATPSLGTMPTFDMFIPEGKDAPTSYHENIPTMVDEEQNQYSLQDQPTIQDQPTLQELPGFSLDPPPAVPSSSPQDEGKEAAPAGPPPSSTSPKSAGSVPGMVSFADLGISFADSEPPASPAAPPPPRPAASPVPSRPASTPPDLPPLDLTSLPGPAAGKKTEAPAQKEPTPPPSLPGLPKGDEPIRLDDLNFFATGSETSTKALLASAPPSGKVDDMSATVDLSELLFGKLDSPSGASDSVAGPSDATRTMIPEASASARPAPGETVNLNQEDRISLDMLEEKTSGGKSIPDLQNQDTVQIPVLNEKIPPRKGEGHPDDSLEATVALADPEAETVIATLRPGASAVPSSPDVDKTVSLGASPKPEEQSFYAAAPGYGGSIDERTERMFREQCERAEKALSEKNWEQAVRFLSIAAAIRPENAEVTQKLRYAREQKRRQEANV